MKQQLHLVTDIPRFRQRLLHQGTILKDDAKLSDVTSVQMVSLPFADTSERQQDKLAAAADRGDSAAVEASLQRPQDPNLDGWTDDPASKLLMT